MKLSVKVDGAARREKTNKGFFRHINSINLKKVLWYDNNV